VYSASFTAILFIPLPCHQHNTSHMLYGHGIPFPIGGGNVCIMGLHAIWLLHSAITCWFAKILVLHVYISFSDWNFCMHLIYCLHYGFKNIVCQIVLCLQENNKYGQNSIHSMTTLLHLTEEARAREQFFRHDVLTWIPPFASLSAPTLPTSASTTASAYMSFHIFLFGGKTWGKIA